MLAMNSLSFFSDKVFILPLHWKDNFAEYKILYWCFYLPTSTVYSVLFLLICSSSYFSVQFSSVTQSCTTLWDLMDCNTAGFPVHHQLPELTQTHVHWVSDAIQPSHPLSSPSPPAFNLSQHQVFSSQSILCYRWPKYWSFSFSISPSNEYWDWFPLG